MGAFFFSFIGQKDAEVRKIHWRSRVFLNQENIALGAIKT
jgi:preprotein translocase subunit SecE